MSATSVRSGTGLAYLLLVLTFLMWSNSFVAARLLVGDDVPAAERIGAFDFVIARFALVGLACCALLLFSSELRRQVIAIARARPGMVTLLGALNVWVYNLAFGKGQHRVPAGTASLIIALSPIFVFLLAIALGQERAQLTRALGLTVALGGIYVVVVHGAGRAVEGAYLGDALTLALAPLSWAVYTVLAKPLLVDHSPVATTIATLTAGSVPTLPFFFFDTGFHQKVATWGAAPWGATLFLAFGCTLLGFWFWFEALRRLPASKTAAFIFLNPPLAIFFEWLWQDRMPLPGLLLGGALVLVGVYLCVRGGAPMPATAVAESQAR